MADEVRTNETDEEIPKKLTTETSDGQKPSPVKETMAENDAKTPENTQERRSSNNEELELNDKSSPIKRTDEIDEPEKSRKRGEEMEREVIEKRVEQEEKIEVQETQETVTEEAGHRESNIESTENVGIEEKNYEQPSNSQVEQQPAERSPDVEVLKSAESKEAEPGLVQENAPLPEPDVAQPEDVHETNKQAGEETASVGNSAETQVENERAIPERSPQPAEAVETRLVKSPLRVGKSPLVTDRSPVPFEKSPFRSGSQGITDREDTPGEKRVKLSTGEIRIPNLKAQLNNTIKDIEELVEVPPQDEPVEEIGKDGEVYHTWKPKGQYDFKQTPVVREEVVAIAVDDVPEPPPVEQCPPSDEGGESGQQDAEQLLSDGSGTVKIQPAMSNGAPVSPIEIPEGIPLLARILPKEEDSNREKIPLERLFTPATDSGEITPRKKKAFASSDFYAPDHPTIDDQLQLAQKISGSLADQTNKTSRGQAMYEKRKQRSEKWIHTDDGKLVQQQVQEDFQAQSSETFSINDSAPKTKPAMKLVLNPKGVQDHTTVEQHYEQLMHESSTSSSGALPSHIGPSLHIPASPEIAKDIINDMQSPTGKGAALFAKRKKRMDKFIVDETNVQRSSAYQQQSVVNSSFEQSFTNQVSSFSSSSTSSSGVQQQQQQQPQAAPAITAPPGSKKRLQQERDVQQQKIMSEFLNKRESQFQLVKSPWEAALEGNTASAFKQNTSSSKMSSSFTSSSTVGLGGPSTWLEGPKPVPVAAPVLKPNGGASLPNPPPPFARPTANAASPATPAAKTAAPAPAVPAFIPAAATPAFVPGASSGNATPAFGNTGLGLAQPTVPGYQSAGLAAASPASASQFTPRATIGSPSLADKRKSANFNLAASGWGTYNEYYRPTSFASS